MSFRSESEHYKYWTQEEDIKLQRLVETGKYSFKEVGKQMNRSAGSCQSHSVLLGLTNKYIRRTHFHNEEFFKVPNLLNCYWAGFLAADGGVTSYSETGSTIRLEINDIDHLHTFKRDVGFTGNVQSSFRKGVMDRTKRVIINSNFWGQDLGSNFGVIPNKTARMLPPILCNDLLKIAFLIGYIDGDGCICITHRNSVNKSEVSVSIVSCSPELLRFLQELLLKYFGSFKLKRKKQNMNNCPGSNKAKLVVFAGMQALMIIDFLKDFPVPKLSRKWHNPKVLEFLQQKKTQYPSFFELTPELLNLKTQILAAQPQLL